MSMMTASLPDKMIPSDRVTLDQGISTRSITWMTPFDWFTS